MSLSLLDRVKQLAGNAINGIEGAVSHVVSPVVQTVEHAAPQVLQTVQQDAAPVVHNFQSLLSSIASQPLIPQTHTINQQISTVAPQAPKLFDPTVGDAGNFVKSILQAIPRSGFEGAQTIAGDKNTYTPKGAVEQALLGTDPLKNFNDQTRPSGKFATSIGHPGLTAPLAIAGAVASDVPFLDGAGSAVEQGGKDAVELAAKSASSKEFASLLEKAAPAVQDAVAGVIKDAQIPIKSTADFFKTIKNNPKLTETLFQGAKDTAQAAGDAAQTAAAPVADAVGSTAQELKNAQKTIEATVKNTEAVPGATKGLFHKAVDYTLGNPEMRGALGVVSKDSPAGKAIVDIHDAANNKIADLAGQANATLHTALKDLTHDELTSFADVVEGKTKPISDAQAQAVQVWKGIREQIHQLATNTGIKAGKIENYFPHFTTQDGKAALDQGSFIERGTDINYGNLVKSRGKTPVDFNKDPNVLFDYINHAYENIVKKAYFGKGDQNLYALAKQTKNPGQVSSILDTVLRKGQQGGFGQKLASGITNLESTKLGFVSPLTNLTQQLSTIARTDIPTAVKTYGRLISDPATALTNAIKAGEVDAKVGGKAIQAMNGLGADATLGQKWLQFIKFGKTENLNRVFSVNAGMEYATKLIDQAKAGDAAAVRALDKLGIPDALKVTEQDLISAGRKISQETQFSTKPGELPQGWSTPTGKVLTQFKSFAYKQTGFVKNLISNAGSEAAKGNFKPLATMLATFGVGSAVEGEIINDVRSLVTNNKRENKGAVDRYLSDVAAGSSLGLLDNIGSLTGQYGESGVVGAVAGPAASDAVKIAGAIGDANKGINNFDQTKTVQQNLDPTHATERFALHAIPGIGAALSNTLVPNSFVDNFVGPNEGLNAKDTATYDRMKANDPQGAEAFKQAHLSQTQPQDNQNPLQKLFGGGKTSSQSTADSLVWTDDNGKKTTVNLKPANGTPTGLGKFKATDQNVKKAIQIWGAPLSQVSNEQKLAAYKTLGVNPDDVRYAYKAGFTDSEKAAYAESQNLDHETLIKQLVTGRKQSIAGTQFASNGVITKLEDDGLISKDEAAAIKKITITKDNKLTTTSLAAFSGKTKGLTASQIRSYINSVNTLNKSPLNKNSSTTVKKVKTPAAPSLKFSSTTSRSKPTKQLFTSYA